MRLSKLLVSLSDYRVDGSANTNVSSITADSRKVKKGSLFIAVRGLTTDGHDFIEGAIAKGAVAVVGQKPMASKFLNNKITYIRVKDSRSALGILAASWYGNPSQKLKVIGVTGTDGKTTTANLIYWILKSSGKRVGLVSTISAKIGNREYDTGFHVTNPDPIPLQKFLSEMVKEDCEYAVLEVTSHGLDQERVAGVRFEVGVLTNITREHLDYHKTFSNYRSAKAKLFRDVKYAILNKDGLNFEYICKQLPKSSKKISYSLTKEDADIYAPNIKEADDKTVFSAKFKGQTFKGEMGLFGNYNVSNALAAVGAGLVCGISVGKSLLAISSFKSLTGRLEKIENSKGFDVYVDFAHTPNALKEVLTVLKKGTGGRLIAIYGCASERDIKKRTLMPKVSLGLADISVFTAEDPRNEPIENILKEMEEAAKKFGGKKLVESGANIGNSRFISIPERGEAISYSIQKIAQKGDTVVVCGKGHEKSMAYNGIEYPWSDQEAVKIALRGGVKKIIRN